MGHGRAVRIRRMALFGQGILWFRIAGYDWEQRATVRSSFPRWRDSFRFGSPQASLGARSGAMASKIGL
jgi:hypothetical protein